MSLAKVNELFEADAVSDDIAPFGWFGIDLTDGTPLWEVRLQTGLNPSQMTSRHLAAFQRAERVHAYAELAEAEMSLFDDGDDPSIEAIDPHELDDDPSDEWEEFFYG